MHSLFNPMLKADNSTLPFAGNVEYTNSAPNGLKSNLSSLRHMSSRLRLANERRPKNCKQLKK